MAENKQTIYQELNSFLNFNGYGALKPDNVQQIPDDKQTVIIKANSPQELHVKALELQQKDHLLKKFIRVEEHGFQKAMQYEAARLPAYIDYEGMEYYPIIAAALDLFAEECTTIGDDGKMLKIYSNKERIKNHLEDLFHNTLNVSVNMFQWVRNLCKYGDNFMYLYGERDKGITFVKQLVNYEIERIEKIHEGKLVVKFRQRGGSNEFETLEIAHFRLLGDDKYLPYGSSALNKIRRVFRQLIMAEDAMLTYRILRAGEKRVFKIPVGNMDENDVQGYLDRVISTLKKTQQVSPSNGQIDYRFNIIGQDEDYFIPVRSENTGTVVDTLQGAQNLDAIQDVEYLRDNLFMGLGIPRPFLSYQSAGGEGKNMAHFDIRFAKKINRMQQSIIQELNKIAVIHLLYLGFTGDELGDFKLMLTNPSSQAEVLKMEILEAKARVYKELTSSDNGSIAAVSHTWAKRNILNWSDKEIIDDLKMQRIEKAINQELVDTPLIIKNTGIFKDIDDKFSGGQSASELTGQESPGQEGGGGGGLGGADLGADLGGGGGAGAEFGGELGGGAPAPGGPAESKKPNKSLLNEQKEKRLDFLFEKLETLIAGDTKKATEAAKDISLENKILNDRAFELIESLEKNIELREDAPLKLYEDTDDEYEKFIKMKDDQLKDQLNSLNEGLKKE